MNDYIRAIVGPLNRGNFKACSEDLFAQVKKDNWSTRRNLGKDFKFY